MTCTIKPALAATSKDPLPIKPVFLSPSIPTVNESVKWRPLIYEEYISCVYPEHHFLATSMAVTEFKKKP